MANEKTPFKHKTNRGSMFDNSHKEEGDNRPHFTGTIDVDGKVYWISAWKETTTDGKRKLSLSVKLQEEREPQKTERPPFPKRAASAW